MDTGLCLASIDFDTVAGLVVHMHEAVHCLCFSGATTGWALTAVILFKMFPLVWRWPSASNNPLGMPSVQ